MGDGREGSLRLPYYVLVHLKPDLRSSPPSPGMKCAVEAEIAAIRAEMAARPGKLSTAGGRPQEWRLGVDAPVRGGAGDAFSLAPNRLPSSTYSSWRHPFPPRTLPRTHPPDAVLVRPPFPPAAVPLPQNPFRVAAGSEWDRSISSAMRRHPMAQLKPEGPSHSAPPQQHPQRLSVLASARETRKNEFLQSRAKTRAWAAQVGQPRGISI